MTTIRTTDQTLDLALIEGPAVIVQRADGEVVVVRSEREGHEVLDNEQRASSPQGACGQTCGVDRGHALRFRKVAITKADVRSSRVQFPATPAQQNNGLGTNHTGRSMRLGSSLPLSRETRPLHL
jgi:hypothetical protein